jgi:hypothetical protein
MIRVCAISLLLSLCALPALAQTVLVRSGEHVGFTRLVLDFPERIDWQDQARENGIKITFPGQRPAFDLSQAFDRLTSGRLARIDAPTGSGELNLTFDCACTARTFWHARSMLVVDILTSAPAETPPATEAVNSGVALQTMARSESAAARLLATRMDPPPVMTEGGAAPTPLMPDDRLLAVRRTLLEQIAQSSAQGLVQPAPSRDTVGEPWSPPTPLAAIVEPVAPEGTSVVLNTPLAEVLTLGLGGNLRVQGAIERATMAESPSGLPSMTPAACLPEVMLDVATWGAQAPLPDQIGALYPRLSGEFDIVNPEVALQLARLYIFFGFGLEARQVLSLIPPEAPDIPVLLELAALVDDPDAGRAAPRLRHNIGCRGRGAFWAALAHEVIPEDQLLDHPAILRGFAELPEHLRQHLGPVLARKLLAAKHRETSDMILRGFGPDSPSRTAGEKIARAELALADGKLDAANQTLQDSLSRNDPDTSDALATMITSRISRNQGIDYDTAQLAGALYQENRGTPVGQEIGRSYLLALTASGSYPEAFFEFDRVAPEFPPEMAEETRQEMLRLLLEKAEHTAFLRQILNEPAARFDTMSADLARRIAQRVLALGFADQAADILSAAPRAEAEPAHRLLMGGIALARGRPHLAEAEIIGLVSPEADALRARARTMLGDHAGAMGYLDRLEDEEGTQRAAWLAQDWPKLLASDDPETQNLAQALTQTAPEKSAGILSYNRALIDQSVETRAALSALLARTEISMHP